MSGAGIPSTPSARITACRCTTPRRWNSATRQKDKRMRSLVSRWVHPTAPAKWRNR